jgi:hypothetical protein
MYIGRSDYRKRMTMDVQRLYDLLVALDDLEDRTAKFDETREKSGSIAWAMEMMGHAIFESGEMARIVRPLIEARGVISDEEWVAEVKAVGDDKARGLLRGYWRPHSTSIFQNAITDAKIDATIRFVRTLEYVTWE